MKPHLHSQFPLKRPVSTPPMRNVYILPPYRVEPKRHWSSGAALVVRWAESGGRRDASETTFLWMSDPFGALVSQSMIFLLTTFFLVRSPFGLFLSLRNVIQSCCYNTCAIIFASIVRYVLEPLSDLTLATVPPGFCATRLPVSPLCSSTSASAAKYS
jgi:hypothetical protein